jgi:hypothetical protein
MEKRARFWMRCGAFWLSKEWSYRFFLVCVALAGEYVWFAYIGGVFLLRVRRRSDPFFLFEEFQIYIFHNFIKHEQPIAPASCQRSFCKHNQTREERKHYSDQMVSDSRRKNNGRRRARAI